MVAISACSNEAPPTPKSDAIISFMIPSDPETLNIMTSTGGFAAYVNNYLYPGLLTLDYDTFELIPFLAESLPTVSDDKLTYTWRLRKGVKWDDFEDSGAYVTSKDVKFSFDVMMDDATGAPQKADFINIKDIEIVDDQTFKIVYREPCLDAIYRFGRNFSLIPAHLLEDTPLSEISKADIGQKPVGFGLFKFHHWTRSKEVLILRNDLNRDVFPEQFRPNLDGIRWLVITDISVAYTKFLRGEVDLCTLSHDQWAYKTDKPEFMKVGKRASYDIPFWSYLAWNNERPFFKDPKVRRAMTHMVRREEILKNHLHGLAKQITGPFFCYSKAVDQSIKPLPFDPKAAQALLEEAGWRDSDGNGVLDKLIDGKLCSFEFELPMGSRSGYEQAMIASLKEDLRMIGIKMNLRPLEWSAFIEFVKSHEADAYTLGFRTTPIFEDPYPQWHSSETRKGGLNRIGYKNSEVDALLEKVRIEYDEEKRYALLNEFHRIIHRDQPFTFLYSLSTIVGINKRWTNTKIHKLGINLYEWRLSDKVPR